MRHICMLAFSHDPYDVRIYHREAKSLAKHGYHISILSLYEGQRQEPLDNNISVKYIEAFHNNIYLLFFIKLYALFREAVKANADIYHCHEPESYIVGIALKLFKRKKLILDVHEYYPDVIDIAGRYYKYVYFLTCYIIEPLFCWINDYIICADDEIMNIYKRLNKNVVTLFNYPLTELWEFQRDNHLVGNRRNNTLVYAGYICESNGIWSMLEVVEELKRIFSDVRLLLIGEISSYLNKEIDRYIESRNIRDYVKRIGNIPHYEVANYLQSANVGLLLYKPLKKYHKNIPTKQYEYAVSELPYVATDLPPIKKFVDDAKCGLLVPPCNVEKAVDAVKYILTHPDDARRMGKNGKKAVYEKYNWRLMEKKLLEIYSHL